MRGDGRIFMRGTTYWCSYYLRGKEFRESTGQTDPDKASKFLRGRLKEVHADEIGAQTFTTPKASRLTIHELVDALRSDFELREKASKQNLSVLKRVESDFGTFRAIELTSERIDKYIEKRLAEGHAKASINRTTQMLGQCYMLAIQRSHLTRAPFIRHLSEVGNTRKGFFSEAELAAVIGHLPNDLKDFVRFAAATGMRKGECASLVWSDVEGDVLTLRGENAKNGEARPVPLIGELAKIIERRKAARRVEENGTVRMVEHIFHREGEAVAEFRKTWASACIAAGVGIMRCPKCGAQGAAKECPTCGVRTKYTGRIFHDLRRSAVRNMTRSGVPQNVAMKISGHKTASIFQRYNIVATDDLREALERTELYRAEVAAKQKIAAMS
jgi:integrase